MSGRRWGWTRWRRRRAIVRVANARMAGAIRLVSIERGHDPKAFVAMPFGGGGSLHAGALIREVGLAKALVPPYPGVTSALGCVIADMRHDFVHTLNGLADSLDTAAVEAEMTRTAEAGRALLDRSAGPGGRGHRRRRRVRAGRHGLRVRHVLSRPDPHRGGAVRAAARRPDRPDPRAPRRGVRGRLPQGLRQPARRRRDARAQPAHLGDRTAAQVSRSSACPPPPAPPGPTAPAA